MKTLYRFQEKRPPVPDYAEHHLRSSFDRMTTLESRYAPGRRFINTKWYCASCEVEISVDHGDRAICDCGLCMENFGNSLYIWREDETQLAIGGVSRTDFDRIRDDDMIAVRQDGAISWDSRIPKLGITAEDRELLLTIVQDNVEDFEEDGEVVYWARAGNNPRPEGADARRETGRQERSHRHGTPAPSERTPPPGRT